MSKRIVVNLVRLACLVLLAGLIISPLGPPRPVAAPLSRNPMLATAAQAAPMPQSAGVAGTQASVNPDQMRRVNPDGSTSAVTTVSLGANETEAAFLAPATKAAAPFSDVVPHFSGSLSPDASYAIELTFSNDGTNYTPAQPASFEQIADPERDAAGEFYAGLVSVPATTNPDGTITPGQALYVQARITLRSSGASQAIKLNLLTFDFLDAPPSNADPNPTTDANDPSRPAIVARQSWGAPTTSPKWPPVYAPTNHAIIHHSGTGASSDWQAQVRALWYYHSYVRGWGDIGYNYLIDPAGIIYEGRAGGLDVAGSHTYPFNYGSVGIALLGNYQYTEMTPAMRDALTKLLGWLAKQRGLDPQATADFSVKANCGTVVTANRNIIAPAADFKTNVCGQTYNASVSPGDLAIKALPDVRTAVAASLPQYGATFLSHDVPPAMITGATYNVNTSVRNSGSQAWSSRPTAPGASKVQLGYRWLDSSGKLVVSTYQPTSLPRDVAFGASVSLFINVTAPSTAGDYTLVLDMAQATEAGPTWFADNGSTALRVAVKVGAGDSNPPVSRITALPLYQTSGDFVVNWSGSDDGSGIASFDVQYKIPPESNWQNLAANATTNSAAFKGQNGYTYYFRVRARDKAGNLEQFRDAPDAQTTVDTVPPALSIISPTKNAIVPTGLITVTGSIERGAFVLVNNIPATVQGETFTATVPTILAGRSYIITAQAWDYAGNTTAFRTLAYLQSNFADLPTSGATRDAIIFVGDRAIIGGYSDNTFRPNQPFIRAEAAKSATLAAGWTLTNATTLTTTATAKPTASKPSAIATATLTATAIIIPAGPGTPAAPAATATLTATSPITASSNAPFSDVPSDYYARDYIATAVARGAITANPPGSTTFQPRAAISRYDLVKLVVIARGWTLENPSTAHFGDVSNSSPYYKYIETAYAHNILPDTYRGSRFNGDSDVTRGEAAYAFYQAFK